LIMAIFALYSLFKTIHVYRRQKEYPIDENSVKFMEKFMKDS